MPDTLTREELDSSLDERLEDFERTIDARIAQLPTGATPAPIGSQWRSAGEFLKALAAGDQEAADFHREYTGGTLADGAPRATWVADAIKLVDRPRTIINMFQRETLPPEGNILEWYKLKADTVKVEKQANEGDNLAYGKIELDSASTKVETYGGYIELSRQAIERSSAPLMTTAQRAMALAYARATEAAVRAWFYEQITAQIAAGNKLDRPAGAIGDLANADWLDVIVDAAEIFEDRGFAIEGLAVSKDVFKALYRLEDGAGHNLMNVYGTGVNVTGEINAPQLTGNLARVPVKLLPKAPAGTTAFYDPNAVTTFESPGAPLQLQDENIINLTKAFSVYGYLAPALPFPGALLPVTPAAG